MNIERKPLTDRQMKIYNFIKREIKESNLPPSVREIGKEFGISSPNGVACHLRALERKGYLRRSKAKARGLELVPLRVNKNVSMLKNYRLKIGSVEIECIAVGVPHSDMTRLRITSDDTDGEIVVLEHNGYSPF